MALVPKTIKTQQETVDLWKKLLADSDCKTEGQFFESLLENYQNPPTKFVADPVDQETIQKLQEANKTLRVIADSGTEALELCQGQLTVLQSENERYSAILEKLDRQFRPYLLLAKKEGIAGSYPEMFSEMLNTIHLLSRNLKEKPWVITTEDQLWLDSNPEE